MSEVELLIKENIWYFYGIFIWVLSSIVAFNWYRHHGRIKIRVKSTPEKTEWRKQENDGTLVMYKAKDKKVGWSITVPDGAMFFSKDFWGRWIPTIEVKPYAKEAINFKTENIIPSIWDAEAEQNLFQAQVIKAAGATSSKLQIPIGLYLILGIILVVGVIGLLLSSGRIRIG